MRFWLGFVALSGSVVLGATQARTPASPAPGLRVRALSTDATRVTGGGVLVEVTGAPATIAEPFVVKAGGRDVSAAFRAGTVPNTAIGLVTGLPLGRTTIEAATRSRSLVATLDVTNYPITGPVSSGPWMQPFICQTDAFVLPDGTRLGPPLDANCSARTVVQYIYKPTTVQDPKQPFKPLPSTTNLPDDVAKTTTAT